MNRVPNADQFRIAFERIRRDYERFFRDQIAALRARYGNLPPERMPPDFDEALEYHARCYVINGFLAGLNWRLDLALEDGLPNLFPEIPLLSEAHKKLRFLDYLGVERSTNNPLLIVEAKRPKSDLPVLATLPDISTKRSRQTTAKSAISVTDDYPSVISRGLNGEPLRGDWPQWLADLRDYIRSADTNGGKSPKRVVITNGDWLVLFLDPAEAFLHSGTCDPRSILVFRSATEILQGSAILFSQLEHQTVLGTAPALHPVQLTFHIQPERIQTAMHGLRLSYHEAKAIYQREPMIYVAPVLFLRTDHGAWLRVESQAKHYALPYESGKLSEHLAEIRARATCLLVETCEILHREFTPISLRDHFYDTSSFDVQRAIVKSPEDHYWVMTGDHTHFLMPEPTVPECPYHDYAKAHTAGVAANSGPILHRSVEPRSFFYSPESHHCAHKNVALAKSEPVTSENRERCGSRSSQDGEAFCEIWSFENRLCCRTCVFEDVCTKTQVFHLPCQRPVQIQESSVSASSTILITKNPEPLPRGSTLGRW